jgi:hypothetical protein
MPDVKVYRHGDRWSVLEDVSRSPTQEHETLAAARAAAERLAAGGTVEVQEEDPTGLDHDAQPAPPPGRVANDVDAVSAAERLRSNQSGM